MYGRIEEKEMWFWRKKKSIKEEIKDESPDNNQADGQDEYVQQDSDDDRLITEEIIVNETPGRFDIVLDVVETHTDDVIS